MRIKEELNVDYNTFASAFIPQVGSKIIIGTDCFMVLEVIFEIEKANNTFTTDETRYIVIVQPED